MTINTKITNKMIKITIINSLTIIYIIAEIGKRGEKN